MVYDRTFHIKVLDYSLNFGVLQLGYALTKESIYQSLETCIEHKTINTNITHTHTHTQDQNQTKQKKLLSYVSHVRMVPDTLIG